MQCIRSVCFLARVQVVIQRKLTRTQWNWTVLSHISALVESIGVWPMCEVCVYFVYVCVCLCGGCSGTVLYKRCWLMISWVFKTHIICVVLYTHWNWEMCTITGCFFTASVRIIWTSYQTTGEHSILSRPQGYHNRQQEETESCCMPPDQMATGWAVLCFDSVWHLWDSIQNSFEMNTIEHYHKQYRMYTNTTMSSIPGSCFYTRI